MPDINIDARHFFCCCSGLRCEKSFSHLHQYRSAGVAFYYRTFTSEPLLLPLTMIIGNMLSAESATEAYWHKKSTLHGMRAKYLLTIAWCERLAPSECAGTEYSSVRILEL